MYNALVHFCPIRYLGCLCVAALLCAGGTLAHAAQDTVQLYREGVPDIVIVRSRSAPPVVREAVRELATYLGRACGSQPPVTSRWPRGKYRGRMPIFVGDSPAARAAGYQTETLAFEQFHFAITPDHIALIGRDDPSAQAFTTSRKFFFREAGTLLAVHTFLHDYLGIRWYFPGPLGEHIPRHPDLSLALGSATMQPARAPRDTQLSCGYVRGGITDTDMAQWARRNRHGGFLLSPGHSFGRIITRTMADRHPEYLAMDRNGRRVYPAKGAKYLQLCLTHPDLADIFAAAAREYFRRDPSHRVFTVMPGDALNAQTCCQCSQCRQWYDTGHAKPGQAWLSHYVWTFVNTVAHKVQAEFPDRLILCCAYGPYRYPPTNFVPEPNLAIAITANRVGFGYQVGSIITQAERWLTLTHTVFIDENYHSGILGLHGTYIETPKICPQRIGRESRARAGLIRGQPYDVEFLPATRDPRTRRTRKDFPGWMVENINLYVSAELDFAPDIDTNQLIHAYCTDLYGPAADIMLQVFHQMEQRWEAGPAMLGISGYNQLAKQRAYRTQLPAIIWGRIYTAEFFEQIFALLGQARTLAHKGDHTKITARVDLFIAALQPFYQQAQRHTGLEQ